MLWQYSGHVRSEKVCVCTHSAGFRILFPHSFSAFFSTTNETFLTRRTLLRIITLTITEFLLYSMKRKLDAAEAMTTLEKFIREEEPNQKQRRASAKSSDEGPSAADGSSRNGHRRVQFATQLTDFRETVRYTEQDRGSVFYSDQDYIKFFVRERSRLAFMNLTKRICMEQERRLRNQIQAIPSYFIVLNFLHAIMTINELGVSVRKHQQQQQHPSTSGSIKFSIRRHASTTKTSNNEAVQNNNTASNRTVVQQHRPSRNSVGASCA
jgi:hypothetical protein